MEKLHILWTAIGLAALSPLLMGADGCIFVDGHEFINTNAILGHVTVDVGPDTEPVQACASDPFGLQTSWGISHGLTLRVYQGTIPDYIWGVQPYGPAVKPLGGVQWEVWGGYMPSQIEIHRGEFGGPFKAIWYTTRSTYIANPAECTASSLAHCNTINIAPAFNTASGQWILGSYNISSGWYVPATGEQCFTVWREQAVACFNTGTGQPWDWCYLPNAVDARFAGPEG